MADTPNLDLPLMASNQSQKHVTHNNALFRLDILVQLTIIDRNLTAPPVAVDGDRYIVAAGGTGLWAGKDLNIAMYINASWIFQVPQTGWTAWILDEGTLVQWDGNSWEPFTLSAGGSATLFGVNTTADATNRLAVKSDGVLFSHDDVTPGNGNMNLAINKATAADDAAVTMQTAFSTRMIFGLLANDDVTLKVSPDGSVFHDAISIDKDTGHVGLNGFTADANNALGVKGTAFLFDAETDHCRFTFNKVATGNDAALTFQSGYSGRALIGLLGSDDFAFTVSPDGSAYTQAILIDKDTAQVTLTQHPKFSGYCNFGQNYAAGSWLDLVQNVSRHNDQADWAAGVFTAPHDGYYMFGAGATFETPGTIPTKMAIGISVNNATPTGDTIDNTGDATITTLESAVGTTALLKLTAGQTVRAKMFFTTNGGRVLADQNYFWGCQIA